MVGGEGAAGAGVEGAFGALGGAGEVGELGLDFTAGAEAGVDDAEGFEVVEGLLVVGEAVELAPGGEIPGEAEPAEVGFDLEVVFLADAGVVDVLEAEKEGASGIAGPLVGEEGGVGVSQVEESGGAGGEAGGHR